MRNITKIVSGVAALALGTTVALGVLAGPGDKGYAQQKGAEKSGEACAVADSCNFCSTSLVMAHPGGHAETATLGEVVPEFELMDQSGQPVSINDFEGKIVVLEWFNDQCPFVKKFYVNGDMNKLADKYEEQGVVWLAIDSSNFSNVEQNAEIAKEWNIDRPILNDASGEIGKAYKAKTTPHMYVIAADGSLAYMGAIDSKPSTDQGDIAGAENFVARALDELLAGESVSLPQTKAYGCSVKY
ncbi:MAG: thioredoxin family protein [Planctomycetota bacterium]